MRYSNSSIEQACPEIDEVFADTKEKTEQCKMGRLIF